MQLHTNGNIVVLRTRLTRGFTKWLAGSQIRKDILALGQTVVIPKFFTGTIFVVKKELSHPITTAARTTVVFIKFIDARLWNKFGHFFAKITGLTKKCAHSVLRRFLSFRRPIGKLPSPETYFWSQPGTDRTKTFDKIDFSGRKSTEYPSYFHSTLPIFGQTVPNTHLTKCLEFSIDA